MTAPILPTHRPARHTRMQGVHSPYTQRGVVLIIALILLVVISLLAVTSMRNVSSSESVASNVRTSELATQSAEIALRHCEDSVQQVVKAAVCTTPTFTTTFTAANILTASNPAHWQNVATWDSTSAAAYVLPLSLVNQTGMTTTYKRPPECMVEPLPMVVAGTSAVSTTAAFVITARGFGPEVAAADSSRTRPTGTEVWLQSHIELDPDSCFTPPPSATPPPTLVTEEEIQKSEDDKKKLEDDKKKDSTKKEGKKKDKKR